MRIFALGTDGPAYSNGSFRTSALGGMVSKSRTNKQNFCSERQLSKLPRVSVEAASIGGLYSLGWSMHGGQLRQAAEGAAPFPAPDVRFRGQSCCDADIIRCRSLTQLRHWVHGSAMRRACSDAPKRYARGGGGAGVRPWRRMISAIFARSGGPPAAALITSADSRRWSLRSGRGYAPEPPDAQRPGQ